MEYVPCALCGANNHVLLFEGRDEWYAHEGTFPTVRCRECGLIYITPRPDADEIGAFYPETYAPYDIAIEDEPSWWRRASRRWGMVKRVNLISAHMPATGRVLDVGCATGGFLVALRDVGWAVQGVEFSDYAATYARTRHQLDVVTGDLLDAGFADESFDLVTFWDVLEHVPEPREALQEAARIAKPDSLLLLVLPNPDSLEARIFGQYWAGWDTPRHLYVYAQPVIERLLAETGWQMTEMVCITGRIWLFNLSMEHWLQNRMNSPRGRRIIMAIMRSLPMRLLSLPWFMLIERWKKGSVMAVFARRR